MIFKRCRRCGAPFYSRQMRTLYCNHRCRERKPRNHHCCQCGSWIENEHGNQRFCAQCADERNRAQTQNPIRDEDNVSSNVPTPEEIAEEQRRAREAIGISYEREPATAPEFRTLAEAEAAREER